MKHIIVAVDGSDPAKRALEMAVSIAQKFEAQVTCLNVYTPLYVPPEPFVITDGNVEESLRKYGEDLAREAAQFAQGKGVKSAWMAVNGAPADAILEVALAKKADLVVVGSRGHGAVSRAVLGSVSTRLTHICSLPLLIVR